MKYTKLLTGLGVAGLISLSAILSYTTVDTISVTVTDKERVTTKEDSYYLVFSDGETFKNEDSLIQLKFSSSDLQGKLKRGKAYTCKVNWFRVPVLSMYRNIINCN